MKKPKLTRNEKIGLIMGVGIVLMGSFFSSIEKKDGKIPDILLIFGIVIIIGVIFYINYDKNKKV